MTDTLTHDIVVVGDTTAAAFAAIVAARETNTNATPDRKFRVCLISESGHVGYPGSEGLGVLDTGFGGGYSLGWVILEFRQRIAQNMGQGTTFPRVNPWMAEKIIRDMLTSAGVTIYNKSTLASCTKDGSGNLLTLTFANGLVVSGATRWIEGCIDGRLATIHGGIGLIAKRESAASTGDALGGYYPNPDQFQALYDEDGNNLSLAAIEAIDGVTPMPVGLVKGDADTDVCVSAYTFRLCVTNDPANKGVWAEPVGGVDMDLIEFLLLTNDITSETFEPFGVSGNLPYTKIDVNGDFSHPYQAEWPEATLTRRAEITTLVHNRMKGWIYYCSQNGSAHCKAFLNIWRPAADEFKINSTTTNNWPRQMYRRGVWRLSNPRYRMTQADLQTSVTKTRTTSLSHYSLDEHNLRWLATTGYVDIDGVSTLQNGIITDGIVGTPYVYFDEDDVIVPELGRRTYPAEVDFFCQLTADAPNCVFTYTKGATKIAEDAMRIDYTVEQMACVAGLLAAMSINAGVEMHAIDVPTLQAAIEARGGVIHYTGPDPPVVNPPDEEDDP